jgi:hypothetical protein
LKAVQLLLAGWGYNTSQDKQKAAELKLNQIDLDGFLSL